MKIKLWWLNEGENYSCKRFIGEYSMEELNKEIGGILDSRPSKYWTLYFEEIEE